MKINILIISLLLGILSANAEGGEYSKRLEVLLANVETNNLQLKAARTSVEAEKEDAKSGNRLGDTSVEYSPFYQNGVGGVASSELIVSQEFDFPSIYSARRKAAERRGDVLNVEYLILKREVLKETAKCYCDYLVCRGLQHILNIRISTADSLLSSCEKRLAHGDATVLDINRIRIERMSLLSEKEDNDRAIDVLIMKMKSLNGGESIDDVIAMVNDDGCVGYCPLTNDIMKKLSMQNLDVSHAEASLLQTEQELKVARQEWLPKLTVGYRRNTEMKESLNGFLVGVSMPLFSNGSKVKASRLRMQAAQQELDNARKDAENQRASLLMERDRMKKKIDVYDVALMQSSLQTLRRAVLAGQMSVSDYYNEADKIFSLMQQRLDAIKQYNDAMIALSALH